MSRGKRAPATHALASFSANMHLQVQPAQQNRHKPHRAAGDGWEMEAHRSVILQLAPEAWVTMRESSHTRPHAWDPRVHLQTPCVHGQPSGRLMFLESLGPKHLLHRWKPWCPVVPASPLGIPCCLPAIVHHSGSLPGSS